MKKRGYFSLILGTIAAISFVLLSSIATGDGRTAHSKLARSAKAASRHVTAELGKLPLRFEANEGQASGEAQFVARGPGYSVLLGGAGATLVLERRSAETLPARSLPQDRLRAAQRRSAERATVRMDLADANRAAASEGLERLETETNYFIGSDPSKWHRGVPNYARVKYREVYPGVDLVYYGNNNRLEYDLLVAAGRNPDVIRMRYTGADSMRVDRDGALVLGVKGSEVRQLQPRAYQTVAGMERAVDARYVLNGNEVRFQLGAYDPSQVLVIDPALVYSTYFGGNGDEFGFGIAVDGSGNVFLTGSTLSTNLPATATIGPVSNAGAIEDVYVVKLDSLAHSITYCDYIGGGNFDEALAIAVDATGAYIGGDTASGDFPTTAGSAQAAFNGTVGVTTNGWLAKLNAAGSALVYATYLGGGGSDAVNNLTVDSAMIVYATGFTKSSGATPFPTTGGAFQTTFGGTTGGNTGDAFVTKLAANGASFVYSTYLGGGGDEQGSAIVIDGSGNAFVAGDTSTLTTFPSPPSAGVIQPMAPAKLGGNIFSGWVGELNAGGTALTFFTYLGGSGSDHIIGLARDAGGNLYVTGSTTSPNFRVMPNPGAAQIANAGGVTFGDAFVTKINSTATAIAYSTYLGGGGEDSGSDIRVDANGFAYVAGLTTSGNFPVTASANQAALAGAQNAFIAKLSPNGTQVVYASYHGGNGSDTAEKMALDGSNNAYFTGFTTSTTFPATPNSGANAVVQTTTGGGQDAFAVKVDASVPTGDLQPTMLAFGNQRINVPSASQALTYTNSGNATLTITGIALPAGYSQTNTCGGSIAAGANCTINVTFQPPANGPFNGTLTATDNAVGSPRQVALTGNGVSPIATLSTNALNFGNQNVGTTSASQMATLTNTGTDILNIASITEVGNQPGDFPQANTCGASLAPAANCTFTVSFKPTNSGARSANIQIVDDSNGIPNSMQNIGLNGTGVAAAGGTFVLSASGPTVTIHPGQTATFALTISPVGAFNQSVGLACTGAPALAACNVLPSSVTPNGVNFTAASATAVVTTTAPGTLAPRTQNPRGTPLWLWGLAAAMMAALVAASLRMPGRAGLRFVAPAVLVLSLILFASACTNGHPGTPTGTSILTVTGTAGAQTQTVNLTLNIVP